MYLSFFVYFTPCIYDVNLVLYGFYLFREYFFEAYSAKSIFANQSSDC